jgi:hypothetical protein
MRYTPSALITHGEGWLPSRRGRDALSCDAVFTDHLHLGKHVSSPKLCMTCGRQSLKASPHHSRLELKQCRWPLRLQNSGHEVEVMTHAVLYLPWYARARCSVAALTTSTLLKIVPGNEFVDFTSTSSGLKRVQRKRQRSCRPGQISYCLYQCHIFCIGNHPPILPWLYKPGRTVRCSEQSETLLAHSRHTAYGLLRSRLNLQYALLNPKPHAD